MSESKRTPKEMAEAIIFATNETNRLLGSCMGVTSTVMDDSAVVAQTMLALLAERDQLQRFKDYVHARLDAAGVPVDPESSHKAEGCRIGGRLDVLFQELAALRERVGSE